MFKSINFTDTSKQLTGNVIQWCRIKEAEAKSPKKRPATCAMAEY
jgi:hypothetical protein